jgi:hypothetical protein
MRDALELLRKHADECVALELRLVAKRAKRDAIALALIDGGWTWREVADAARFANPYIATLKRKARADRFVK